MFANYRRNGYDFDSLYEDELANYRSKKIMDLFPGEEELFSFEVRRKAGFEKGGEKNFEGVMTALQMRPISLPGTCASVKMPRDSPMAGQ